ncbi:unnamed protein product, partial [Phaeothamnion confervicola]
QIPQHATVSGDCRVTPFYDVAAVRAAMEGYVADMNTSAGLAALPTRGSFSRYELPDEGVKGKLELTWVFDGENGIACDLGSAGHSALLAATREVLGGAAPYSISGSLPLVRWMQDNGYDVQICGYGLSSKYHAENECCSLEAMRQATQILARVVKGVEAATAAEEGA